MDGRFRLLFLRAIIIGIFLSGYGLTDVYAAEKNNEENKYDIGIYVEGEKTVGGVVSQNKQVDGNSTNESTDKNSIKDVQVDEGADQVIQPSIKRREISVDQIDTEDFEIGVFGGMLSTEDFGANLVMGLRAAYHITEFFFLEAAYATSETTETSYERLSGGAQLMTPEDRQLTYYNISVGFNIFPGEAFIGNGYAFNTALYAVGGAGITRFAGDDRFTINYGLGYRFLATDWFALHFDVRDHIFNIDLLGEEKTAHNLETHGGITVFF